MKQAQPEIVTKEQLARLVNVFLPDDDLSTRSAPDQAQVRAQINWRLYLRIVKLHPEHMALARLRRNGEINEAEFRRRKTCLFYKLMGEYNAALLILRRGLALDLRIFYQTITDDTTRMTFFTSFCAGGLDHDAYIEADQARVAELIDAYSTCLDDAATTGEVITDLTFKLI
jgi:hypothetical protein